jgi:hypothetical protein
MRRIKVLLKRVWHLLDCLIVLFQRRLVHAWQLKFTLEVIFILLITAVMFLFTYSVFYEIAMLFVGEW